MKKDDRVVLSGNKANVSSSFWQRRNVDCNSIGTILSTWANPIPSNLLFVEVRWDNGIDSICNSVYLRLYKSENIPLPNKKFMELRQRGVR